MSVAVVTGGSRGIGAATVRRLRDAGHDVLFSYRADAAAARAVAESTGSVGIRADVADEADVLRLFAAADEMGSQLRVLVNNAGIVGTKTTVAELTADRVRRIFDVNVVGLTLCCREAVCRMTSGAAIVDVR